MKLHRSFLSYDLDIFMLLKSIRYIKCSVIKIGMNTVMNPYFFITLNLIYVRKKVRNTKRRVNVVINTR